MKIVSIIFLAVGFLLVAFGIFTMYDYEISSRMAGKIVGGDAYNYIIIANRGIAIVGVGLFCGMASLLFGFFSIKNKINN